MSVAAGDLSQASGMQPPALLHCQGIGGVNAMVQAQKLSTQPDVMTHGRAGVLPKRTRFKTCIVLHGMASIQADT